MGELIAMPKNLHKVKELGWDRKLILHLIAVRALETVRVHGKRLICYRGPRGPDSCLRGERHANQR